MARRNPISLANAPPNRCARTGRLHPTARWQDKSRKLRRGRVAEEFRFIKHLTRSATEPHSLPICTTHWDFTTTRTSRAPAS
jgi:hypothetical protein